MPHSTDKGGGCAPGLRRPVLVSTAHDADPDRRVSALIWLALLAVLVTSLDAPPPPVIASPAQLSPTLPDEPPHRYVIFLDGVDTESTANSSTKWRFFGIEMNLRLTPHPADGQSSSTSATPPPRESKLAGDSLKGGRAAAPRGRQMTSPR